MRDKKSKNNITSKTVSLLGRQSPEIKTLPGLYFLYKAIFSFSFRKKTNESLSTLRSFFVPITINMEKKSKELYVTIATDSLSVVLSYLSLGSLPVFKF